MKKLMLKDDAQFANKKSFDRDFDIYTVKILPGEYFAAADATAITTLLGSCVSVCLYDRNKGVGGMNHFMLPKILLTANAIRCALPYEHHCTNPCSARYGECAFKHLLEQLEKFGARRGSLEAKLFGAGRVMAGGSDIGRKNAEFALAYLDERNIPVVASDLGDGFSRKVIFFPATGRAFVKRLLKEPGGTF
jgi:chemotaxis protein CheD